MVNLALRELKAPPNLPRGEAFASRLLDEHFLSEEQAQKRKRSSALTN